MTGRLYKIEKGLIYVVLEGEMDGQRAWFESLGSYDIESDDVISRNLWNLAGEVLKNETKGYDMDVFMRRTTHDPLRS